MRHNRIKKSQVEAMCLSLGMAIKSITGSHKVIDILNRLGHSISYFTMEELETELTFAESNREQIKPTGMNFKVSLATGVAFDDFDRFVETLSEKDTLHHTIGIAYQLSTEEIENSDKDTVFLSKPVKKKYQTLTWR